MKKKEKKEKLLVSSLDSYREKRIHRVDRNCLSSLKILFYNSKLDSNTSIACLHPKYWWDSIIDVFYDNVTYVQCDFDVAMEKLVPDTKSFEVYYRQVTTNYVCENIDFDTIDEMCLWFKKNKFNNISLYRMVKKVDMQILKEWYSVTYTFIVDKQESRNNKIEHIMDNGEADYENLPF